MSFIHDEHLGERRFSLPLYFQLTWESQAKRRRDAKRTKLKNEYHNRKTETQEEITNIFSEFEQKSHRAHRVQLERLVALLKRKEDIEGRMSTSIKALERAYLARCAEFKAAIDGRIAELH